MSIEEIRSRFPSLETGKDIRACLAYAADREVTRGNATARVKRCLTRSQPFLVRRWSSLSQTQHHAMSSVGERRWTI